ncbi:MAG: hypothetical protein LBI57_04695 [Helicobacteraceae bacterium]|jgi:hypothetical protein|nr:hypothetical protein [Helicobacteraceae bacterium]
MDELEGFVLFIAESLGVKPEQEAINRARDNLIRYYRAGSIAIPSYKQTLRNQDILNEYRDRLRRGVRNDQVTREIAAKYYLSPKYVSAIINDARQPRLFENER